MRYPLILLPYDVVWWGTYLWLKLVLRLGPRRNFWMVWLLQVLERPFHEVPLLQLHAGEDVLELLLPARTSVQPMELLLNWLGSLPLTVRLARMKTPQSSDCLPTCLLVVVGTLLQQCTAIFLFCLHSDMVVLPKLTLMNFCQFALSLTLCTFYSSLNSKTLWTGCRLARYFIQILVLFINQH